ncbi:MAG: paraslipin [Magnetococcales bacterium]|nr:paraslipin [Magnetococcales bacterium]MBF0150568.1 paraslipin [Magnetococcales bacterium]MBF0171819.1 paraslipin [Magnetococcales bacterium]MBF0346138.1 paraslipin [Magnetococcales bacterium]MBF0632578.1 paraslipin [Magnetococcales bacterium]
MTEEAIIDIIFNFWTGLAILVLVILKNGLRFVPQNRAHVVERFGKYYTTLTAGINFLVPFIDKVAYDQTLKEMAVDVPSQSAITKDNISLEVDGILYTKVIDPYKASYGIENFTFAVAQLAQTTMRSEIGKLELDRTFEERLTLNANIVSAINEAAAPWGIQVLRYEIKDIKPPKTVLEAMERQMKAEREKRAAILESEGLRDAAINNAEGEKRSKVLAAEADRAQAILRAEGEALAITTVAEAKARALKMVGDAAASMEGQKAVQFDLATRAIQAKEAIARQSSVVLMDAHSTSTAHTVAEAMAMLAAINQSGAMNLQPNPSEENR